MGDGDPIRPGQARPHRSQTLGSALPSLNHPQSLSHRGYSATTAETSSRRGEHSASEPRPIEVKCASAIWIADHTIGLVYWVAVHAVEKLADGMHRARVGCFVSRQFRDRLMK